MKQRRKMRRKKSSFKWGRFLVFLILLGLFVAGIIWGSLRVYQRFTATPISLPRDEVTANISSSRGNSTNDSDVMYVLLVGLDGHEPVEANLITLAVVNVTDKRIDFISIPDNTKILNRDGKTPEMLSSFYSKGGISLVKAVVEDIVHVPIPYYVVVTPQAFEQTVDIYGKIDMYVEKKMEHYDENGIGDINLWQGYQSLDGKQALGYMRYIDKEANIARVQREQRFIKIFCASLDDHVTLGKLYDTFRVWKLMDSNISTYDAVKLAFKLRSTSQDNIRPYILPGMASQVGDTLYWNIDPVETQKIVGNSLNALALEDKKGE